MLLSVPLRVLQGSCKGIEDLSPQTLTPPHRQGSCGLGFGGVGAWGLGDAFLGLGNRV